MPYTDPNATVTRSGTNSGGGLFWEYVSTSGCSQVRSAIEGAGWIIYDFQCSGPASMVVGAYNTSTEQDMQVDVSVHGGQVLGMVSVS